MPVKHYLSVNEIADLLGISVNTIKGYRRYGTMPEPDAKIGNAYGWSEENVLKWHAERPGQGARTDLA